MKTLFTTAILLLAVVSTPAIAMDDDDHFEGLPAETLDDALTNLRAGLPELHAALGGELDELAMNDIHELTYTLENAMARLRLEIIALEAELEALHLASERWDAGAVRTHGATYLEGASKLAGASAE